MSSKQRDLEQTFGSLPEDSLMDAFYAFSHPFCQMSNPGKGDALWGCVWGMKGDGTGKKRRTCAYSHPTEASGPEKLRSNIGGFRLVPSVFKKGNYAHVIAACGVQPHFFWARPLSFPAASENMARSKSQHPYLFFSRFSFFAFSPSLFRACAAYPT